MILANFKARGDTLGNSWRGMCQPAPQILTLFQTKKVSVIFHTCFQTWPLKSVPILRHGLYEIMSSLLRLEQQQKKISYNSFRIHIQSVFLFLSYLFGIETINTFVKAPVVPLKSITDCRPKWAKSVPQSSDQNGAKTISFGAAYWPICFTYQVCVFFLLI